ncbi:MAG: ACT domain-containing protein, partial [Candidatus Nanohaloarchaea archaeon]
SVAEEVEEYVEKRPYIREALAQEVVNYSALARQVQEEVSGGFEAVKMALRRHTEDLREERRHRINNIAAILDGTTIELRSNVQVCMSDVE